MHDGSQLVLDREAEAAILPQARDSNSDECIRQSVQRDDGPVPQTHLGGSVNCLSEGDLEQREHFL